MGYMVRELGHRFPARKGRVVRLSDIDFDLQVGESVSDLSLSRDGKGGSEGAHPGVEDHFLAGVRIDPVHVYSAERVAVLFSVVEVGPHLFCELVRDVVHSACARGSTVSLTYLPLKGEDGDSQLGLEKRTPDVMAAERVVLRARARQISGHEHGPAVKR